MFGKKAPLYDSSNNNVLIQNGVDVLLSKYGFTKDPPVKYMGVFLNNIAECNMGTHFSTERFDPADIYLHDDQDGLVEGETYTVHVSNRFKKTVFRRWIDGPLYKWSTHSGLYMCLSQADVDTLTEEENRGLRIL